MQVSKGMARSILSLFFLLHITTYISNRAGGTGAVAGVLAFATPIILFESRGPMRDLSS